MYLNTGMGHGSNNLMIASLIASVIKKQFKLDDMYYGVLMTVISEFIDTIREKEIVTFDGFFNNAPIILFICLFGYIFYCFYKKYNREVIIIDNRYKTANLIQYEKIKIFNQYLEKNMVEFFKDFKSVQIGHVETEMRNIKYGYNSGVRGIYQFSSILDREEEFHDPNFPIEGKIMWKKHEEKTEKTSRDEKETINTSYIYIVFKINKKKSKISFMDYIDKIESYVYDVKKHDISLYFSKTILEKSGNKYGQVVTRENCKNHTIVMYDGIKKPIEEREKLFIDSFFHRQKDKWWSYFKNIEMNPELFHTFGQNPRLNLILYGPKGSGKSSFIYRVAMGLNRHIVSLDLRGIENRYMAYQLMQKPTIIMDGCTYSIDPKKCIIVLEEFDITINELYQKSIKKKKKWGRYRVYNKYYGSSDDEEYDFDLIKNIPSTSDKKEKDKKNKDDKDKDDKDKDDKDKYDKDDKDDKDKDKKDKDDKDKDSKKKTNTNDTCKSNFCLRDLLELFQGTVPIDGSIIMATTNKFDQISELCPELFRDGRLTPVYFDYLDRDNFDNMCEYYFNQKLENVDHIFTGDITNIPTSSITSIALHANIKYHNDKNLAFEYFKKEFQQVIEKYN